VEIPPSFGPFAVQRELGRGTGGVVYEAFDVEHGRPAAVKLYTSAPKDATAAIARLRRDAQAAGALGHPNLAAVLGVGDHEGQPWVATELVAGVSLAQVLRSRPPLAIERVLDIWRQICEGLAHAHREGVLHLDLKPADVRLSQAGDVKVLDFGSWHLKALERQVPGDAPEGLHYRAPEIVAGRRPDRRADVFSTGAIVFELATYRKAFPGGATTDVLRALSRGEPDFTCVPKTPFSPGFERILATSLARQPEARHASFEDVHADLVALVREAVPRLREVIPPASPPAPGREGLVAAVTQARAEDRLEDALEECRKLLALDGEDEWARRALSDVESVLVEREVDQLVGLALGYAADGELDLATGIAEKVERLAPWSPRYLQLQVYLDEEKARRNADRLVATARQHLAEGREWEARAAAQDALALLPGHGPAQRLLLELGGPARVVPAEPPAPPHPESPPSSSGPPPPASDSALPTPGPPPGASGPDTPGPSPASPVPGPERPAPAESSDPRQSAAVALSAVALRHFLANEHAQARQAVEEALSLDPTNRRALELQKILLVLG
jgi:tetratricopeptide (TPR) repeat protein